VTLTIYSPENIQAGDRQQIFTGAGSIAFSKGGRVSAEWAYSGTGGAAAAVQLMVDALAGQEGEIVFPSLLTVNSVVLIDGDNDNLILSGYGRATGLVAGSTNDVLDIIG